MSGIEGASRMGRPREFDWDTAVRGAMEVFWRQGYKATNLPDLLDAMGLTRGSFYKAFGDKENVYLAALEQYDREVIASTVEMLEGCHEATASACLSHMFSVDCDTRRGCFLCNAIVELAADNPKVAEKTNAMTDQLRAAVQNVLIRYQSVSSHAQARATADLVVILFLGFKAVGKSATPDADWGQRLKAMLGEADEAAQ